MRLNRLWMMLVVLLGVAPTLCLGADGVHGTADAVTAPAGFFLPPTVPLEAEALCLECKGAGVVASVLKQKDERSVTKTRRAHQTQLATVSEFKVPCKVCKGRKRYVRKLTLQERVDLYHKWRGAYEVEQTMAQRHPVGAAYLEKTVADMLSPEEFAKLAASYPIVCKKCVGFTAIPCKRCESLGFTEQVDDVTGEKVREVCTTCDGHGEKRCKSCNETGLAKLCKRCKGLGVMRRPATKRKPATIERCPSCDGMCRR